MAAICVGWRWSHRGPGLKDIVVGDASTASTVTRKSLKTCYRPDASTASTRKSLKDYRPDASTASTRKTLIKDYHDEFYIFFSISFSPFNSEHLKLKFLLWYLSLFHFPRP
jgi:hypothetical protein